MKNGRPGSGPQESEKKRFAGKKLEVENLRKREAQQKSSPAYKAAESLVSKGYVFKGYHKGTVAGVYKHPNEKGSVLLTSEGHVLANE